jgi:Na+/H+ antiporter NhaD/arsenite permease-like protein
MKVAALAIFAATYVLVAVRHFRPLPVGRPAGAMLGATAMVAMGVLTPADAYVAIDHDTILLLFGMMLLTAWITDDNALDGLVRAVVRRAGTPWRLLVAVSLLAAFLSAFLVNDTVCVFLTPVVVAVCQRAGLPLGPFLIALATSANIGSACTLVGNPQNMIIGSRSGIPFAEFLLRSLPATVAAMGAELALLRLFYRRHLPARLDLAAFDTPSAGRFPLAGWVGIGVVAGFLAGLHMGFTALAGVAVLLVIHRRDPAGVFARLDWTLLVFFASLFIVVGGLQHTGLVDIAIGAARPWLDLGTVRGQAAFTALFVAGSNLVSNVPMVMLAGPWVDRLGDPDLAWVELAFVTTVAGNLTLLGSMANLIVAERSRDAYDLGFFEYLRFGVATTLASLAVGVPLIVLTARLLG